MSRKANNRKTQHKKEYLEAGGYVAGTLTVFIFSDAVYQYYSRGEIDWKEILLYGMAIAAIPAAIFLIILSVVHGRRSLRKRREKLYGLQPLSVRQQAAEEKKSVELSFCLILFLLLSGMAMLAVFNILEDSHAIALDYLGLVFCFSMAIIAAFLGLRLLRKNPEDIQKSKQDIKIAEGKRRKKDIFIPLLILSAAGICLMVFLPGAFKEFPLLFIFFVGIAVIALTAERIKHRGKSRNVSNGKK